MSRIYVKILWLLAVGLLVTWNAYSQSYDVSDAVPPSRSVWESYEITPVSILFTEKYRLLVDIDCHTGQLIIDVRLKGGSVASNIDISRDSVIDISLISSALWLQPRVSGIIAVPLSFTINVSLENDTATFHVGYSDEEIHISMDKESWFIEPEPLLKLPANVFWIITGDGKAVGRISDELRKENLADMVILDKGYYRCFPGGYIRKRGNRNESLAGPVYFFVCNHQMSMARVDSLVNNSGDNRVLLGFGDVYMTGEN